MNHFSLLILTVFCQHMFTPSLATPQSTSMQNFNLQIKELEELSANILTDYVSTEFGLFKIHQSRVAWNDARNICLDENAQLAIIDSEPEESMLLKFMKANEINAAWLGVHDLFGKKQWTTIKGDRLYTLGYVHWRNGEPNSSGAGEHCVELHYAGMNDIACETERSFICERIGIDIRSL